MKIGILATNPQFYSTQRLFEAGKLLGHDVSLINTLECCIDIASKTPRVKYKNEDLSGYDAIIPRIGAPISYIGTTILRQFEMMGIFTLNESNAIIRSRDKLRSLQLLSQSDINFPKTIYPHNLQDTKEIINLVGGAPLILKLLEGSQGKGVVLAETQKSAENLIDAFREVNANFLIQEFVKEAFGVDIRCFVIGDEVVGSMKRQAEEGEFRSNLHRGGTGTAVEISEEERKAAIFAANAMGLNVAGVDIIRSNNGPKVIEVNSSPGLEGIEKATGKDIASLIYQFIAENNSNKETKIKNRG